MQEAATRLLSKLSGVNVGLMRYSRNGGSGDLEARGGMVAYPVSPIEANRQALIDAVNSWDADGFTPLSETLFEAYRYFTGGGVGFGNISVPFHSVAGSRNPPQNDGANYESPADFSCQPNYIVYLTDGLPTSDAESNGDIQGLTDFATLGGACDAANSGPDRDWPNSGLCLAALARYMFNADMRTDVASKQNVTSYWIGFGSDVAGGAARDYLDRAALAGSGGKSSVYLASSSEELTNVLTGLSLGILQTNTTFSAPTVAVNAFNRTRSLSDLYVSVFQPSGERHWPGNLKKYASGRWPTGPLWWSARMAAATLRPRARRQSTTQPASSSTPRRASGPTARRAASARGGAANELPEPGHRNVYTYIGANPAASSPVLLTLPTNEVVTGNAVITDTLLEMDRQRRSTVARRSFRVDPRPGHSRPGAGDCRPPGVGDGNTTERRRAMGDPIHAQPAIVIYGGTEDKPDLDDAWYVPTNDGYLHAIRYHRRHRALVVYSAGFIPLQYDLYENDRSQQELRAWTASIRVLKFDVNDDGIVAWHGDRVILYFGMGRGGSGYYALDVTDKRRRATCGRSPPRNCPVSGRPGRRRRSPASTSTARRRTRRSSCS